MPCTDGSSRYDTDQELQNQLRAVTRAACDMADLIKKSHLTSSLTIETQRWIGKHDVEDQARLNRERIAGEQERLKQKALDKLDQDERRALGL